MNTQTTAYLSMHDYPIYEITNSNHDYTDLLQTRITCRNITCYLRGVHTGKHTEDGTDRYYPPPPYLHWGNKCII